MHFVKTMSKRSRDAPSTTRRLTEMVDSLLGIHRLEEGRPPSRFAASRVRLW